MNDHYSDMLLTLGYVICTIKGGRLDPDAKWAVADPQDDEDGLYLEGESLPELLAEASVQLGLNDPGKGSDG